VSTQEDSTPSARDPRSAPAVQNERSGKDSADIIRDLQNSILELQSELAELRDTDARFARLEESQALALRAAFGIALVVSAFSAILWAAVLFADASDNPTRAYFALGITFVALFAGLLLASVFVFKPIWLEPLKDRLAPVVNRLKRRRRRRD